MQSDTRHSLPEIVDRERVAATRAGLPAEAVLADAVEVFKVLSSPVRICIMHALAHGELSVGDLARALDLSLSGASHQLTLLRRMKLVAARRDGRLTFYRATGDFVGHLVHDCLAHVDERLGLAGHTHHHPHGAALRVGGAEADGAPRRPPTPRSARTPPATAPRTPSRRTRS